MSALTTCIRAAISMNNDRCVNSNASSTEKKKQKQTKTTTRTFAARCHGNSIKRPTEKITFGKYATRNITLNLYIYIYIYWLDGRSFSTPTTFDGPINETSRCGRFYVRSRPEIGSKERGRATDAGVFFSYPIGTADRVEIQSYTLRGVPMAS